MAILIYKIIHLTGIVMTMMALGGLMVHAINGGAKSDLSWRKGVMATHGIGMFLVLLGGFGMLARLGIHWPWPGWIMVKFGLWIVLGAFSVPVYKAPTKAKGLWLGLIVLFVLAAYMAFYKPF